MEDELTTLMHWEFIRDEIPLFDIKIMDVYGASEKDYDDNIDRVLNS